jgi:hypothetical protein
MKGIRRIAGVIAAVIIYFSSIMSPGHAWGTNFWATYGAKYTDVADSIQKTADGGYIMAGHTGSFYEVFESWVLKINGGGDVQWEKLYWRGGDYNNKYAFIHKTDDGGYSLFWNSQDSSEVWNAIFMLKLNANGEIQWHKAHRGYWSDSELFAYSIQPTDDGGYIVAGETNTLDNYVYVLKLNADGEIQWNKTYYDTVAYDTASSIQQTRDGGYIVVGWTYFFNDHESGSSGDILVMKLNRTGEIQWQRTYGGESWDKAYAVRQTSDGGYIVAGETYSFGEGAHDIWVLKLNADGEIQWQKTYGGSGTEHTHSIQQTVDGGYIVVGRTKSYGGGQFFDTIVLKLDADGNVEWEKAYGGASEDIINSIHQTNDGGYILAGQTYSDEVSYEMWVLRLDHNGDIGEGCSDIVTNTNLKVLDSSAVLRIPTFVPNDDLPRDITDQTTVGSQTTSAITNICRHSTTVVWYVDADVTSSGNGTSWATAFNTIQEAIDVSSGGDEVWVKEGTHSLTKPIEVNKFVAIYGGFNGKEDKRDKRNWKTNITTVDGQGSVGCLHFTVDALIDGFSIVDGSAGSGAGISVDHCSPTIINCTFSGNSSVHGAGILNVYSAGTIANCVFFNNSASFWGGAMANYSSSPTITNCTFTLNSAESIFAGAIFNGDSSFPTITNCILWGNTAPNNAEIHDEVGCSSDVTYCDIDQDGFAGINGNIREAPRFFDPDNSDFHLEPDSPCIDAGTGNAPSLPSTDFEGDPRVVGSAPDMGADEYLGETDIHITNISFPIFGSKRIGIEGYVYVNGEPSPFTVVGGEDPVDQMSSNELFVTDSNGYFNYLSRNEPNSGIYQYRFFVPNTMRWINLSIPVQGISDPGDLIREEWTEINNVQIALGVDTSFPNETRVFGTLAPGSTSRPEESEILEVLKGSGDYLLDGIGKTLADYASSPMNIVASLGTLTCLIPEPLITKGICVLSVTAVKAGITVSAAKGFSQAAIEKVPDKYLSPSSKQAWNDAIETGTCIYSIAKLDPASGNIKTAADVVELGSSVASFFASERASGDSPSGRLYIVSKDDLNEYVLIDIRHTPLARVFPIPVEWEDMWPLSGQDNPTVKPMSVRFSEFVNIPGDGGLLFR